MKDDVRLEPLRARPQDDLASRWRRLGAGLFDFFIALIVAGWVCVAVSEVVELGTATSAAIVIAAGWAGLIAYLALPWSLARSAFGMRIQRGATARSSRLLRGLLRAVLLPLNVLLLLVLNRHVGDFATTTRVVRAPVNWLCAVLVPLAITVGYAGATRAFTHAAMQSDAWAKAQQAIGPDAELRQFSFRDNSAVFASSWGYQELVRLQGAWYVVRATPAVGSDESFSINVSLTFDALSIGGSQITTLATIDLPAVRTELITTLTRQVEERGMKLSDVECGAITGPTHECHAQLTKPGEAPTKVTIAIRLDDKSGMTGKFSAP